MLHAWAAKGGSEVSAGLASGRKVLNAPLVRGVWNCQLRQSIKSEIKQET